MAKNHTLKPRHTRRTEKQRIEREIRDDREQRRGWQERAQRRAMPRDDDGPLPRID